MAQTPKRREVWNVQFAGKPNGRKSGKADQLPALVISANEMNELGNTVIVLPIFPSNFSNPARVEVTGTSLSLEGNPHAACDQVRAINQSRMLKRLGQASPTTMNNVERALLNILNINPRPRQRGWGAC